MTKEEILTGESKNVEFKVSRPEKSIKYMKSVVAFANGKGGRIVFGIDDETREIVGIPKESVFREMDAIANAISDSCEPVIVPDIYPQTIDEKTIIIVEISAEKQRPYYIKQEGITQGVYMRVAGTTRKADRVMTQEMYYESEGRSYDTVIRRNLTVSDEEIDTLCAQMKEVALANCKNAVQRQSVKDVTKNVLLNWGVLAEDEDGIHPTNAYIFLTGQDDFLSKIQCGMFKGTTRAVFVDKRDYEGLLWQQAEEAFQFVLRNIRLGARIEGLYRQDIYELPPDSIRELIINAVLNCSFLQPSHIQVAIYDDRLEITSPGGLMPGVTIDRMKEGYSQIRNRALAHAFSYMNLIEGWGTGIPRLLREMKEYGLAEPEFIDMETALRMNLYRTTNTVQNDGEKVPE
ncbi:MAG: ATP-binding protein, partial [Planctomycetia bacterium]|nr:ATP-binding protein [Planctomycetia bacterium]